MNACILYKYMKSHRNDVISLNNFRVGDFVDRIYPIELEINYITDTDSLLHTLTYTSKLTVRSVKR